MRHILTLAATFAITIATAHTLSPTPTLEYRIIPSDVISSAMNERLASFGYDDTTLPIPRPIAIESCYTDSDCKLTD